VEIVSQGLELVSQDLELVSQGLELVSQGLELEKNITMSFPSHRTLPLLIPQEIWNNGFCHKATTEQLTFETITRCLFHSAQPVHCLAKAA
jgi:hypothetical protein